MFRRALTRSSGAFGSRIRFSAQPPIGLRLIPRTNISARPVALRFARCFSADKDTSTESGKEREDANAPIEEGERENAVETQNSDAALQTELEAKQKEVKEWKDRYLRSVAEFRNLQDRTQRDIKQARDFAIQKFAKDLVDSVDNLDRALAMVPQEKLQVEAKTEHQQDLINLYEGLKMSESVMMQTLAKHGLERFHPAGEKFNPNEHEATFMTPVPDKEDGTVFDVQQKGFKLNGRIIRAAKVGIVKNK